MIESEGITENVKMWRTEIVTQFIDALGLEKPMFEAGDPEVFSWYIKNYGAEINLFVDHHRIVQLEMPAVWYLGHEELLGPGADVRTSKKPLGDPSEAPS